jgi:CheY-like chemotaxis protein
VRLIALSGYSQPEDRKRAIESGFDLHLIKPVKLSELLAALNAEKCRSL